MNNIKGSNRDHNKATNIRLRTTGKRQRIPKGMRNHTKTGTKGAQTTDNRTEGSTEKRNEKKEKISNGTQAQTQPPIKKKISHPSKNIEHEGKGRQHRQ